MKSFGVTLAASLLAAMMVPLAAAQASQDAPPPVQALNLSGLHAFDLRAGRWVAHHRRLKERLAGSHEWITFDGTCDQRLLMDGWANVDENVFNMPGGAFRGVTMRTYDPKTGLWSIWWFDGRTPSEVDVPVTGRFDNGIGTFYSDDTFNGKPIRVRFEWSNITAASAHWEQAFSADGGKTWETNWTTDFERSK